MNREEMLKELDRRGRTTEVALDLSIRKWRDIVNGEGIDSCDLNCALCEVFKENVDKCGDCPMEKDGNRCGETGSFWRKYRHDGSQENAQAMLDYLVGLQQRLYPKRAKWRQSQDYEEFHIDRIRRIIGDKHSVVIPCNRKSSRKIIIKNTQIDKLNWILSSLYEIGVIDSEAYHKAEKRLEELFDEDC